jgi:hypothetical protein
MRYNNSCNRCKIYHKTLYQCEKCNTKLCEKCIKEIYPDFVVTKDNKDTEDNKEFRFNNNNIISDYCYYRCNMNLKYCNDCGKNYKTISRCKGCLISLCFTCKTLNNKQFYHNLTSIEKTELTNYCSSSCYIIHNNLGRDTFTNCKKCKVLFINPYKYKNCTICRVVNIVENDITRNKKRKSLQIQVNTLLKDGYINKKTMNQYCLKVMTDYINKRKKNISENNITLDQWLNDTDSGLHSCMNLWDYAIEKYI